ncbi:MAG TPA: substrate-binding domain-containing protein, partial [Treponemataceae bacterium]|nr:substrate-binding domain-containing protein [Treponemataceae bacterium]
KPALELVLSNNDDMALGVISRMRQEGWFKDSNGNGRIDQKDASWIPVVGIDGIADARESIAEGYLYGTVTNNSLQMAASIVELTEMLLGERSEQELSVPLTDGKYIWVDYQPYISR